MERIKNPLRLFFATQSELPRPRHVKWSTKALGGGGGHPEQAATGICLDADRRENPGSRKKMLE
jgi:hypothetical protein